MILTIDNDVDGVSFAESVGLVKEHGASITKHGGAYAFVCKNKDNIKRIRFLENDADEANNNDIEQKLQLPTLQHFKIWRQIKQKAQQQARHHQMEQIFWVSYQLETIHQPIK